MQFLSRIFLALLFGVPAGLWAQVAIAYSVPVGATSNQFISNPLGMDFNVNRPIYVVSVGVFDSGQDGLAFSHVVRIYDRNTQTSVVMETVPAGTTAALTDGSRFVALATPFLLPAGFQGSIVAEINVTDGNGNTHGGTGVSLLNDGGGALTFVGGGRVSDNGPGVYPLRIDGGPANRYLAGTFAFTAVPEPSSVALLGFGLAVVGTAAGRWRRNLRRGSIEHGGR